MSDSLSKSFYNGKPNPFEVLAYRLLHHSVNHPLRRDSDVRYRLNYANCVTFFYHDFDILSLHPSLVRPVSFP